MSILKDVLTKRFWLSVLVVFAACVLTMAMVALVLSGGLADHHQTGLWAGIAWVIGGFAGGRFAVQGKSGTVPRSLLTAAVAYVVILLIGLVVPGQEMLTGWWRNAACVIGGALAAGLISPGKKKRAGKIAGKQKRKKPR